MGQLRTWFSMLAYSIVPTAGGHRPRVHRFLDRPRPRAQTRRHRVGRAPALREALHRCGFPDRAGAVAGNSGHLDRGPLFRRQRLGRRRGRLARSCFRQSALVLSVRNSVLFRLARLSARHRCHRRLDLLAGRARLADSFQRWRLEPRPGNQPQRTAPGGSARIEIPARHGRRLPARAGGALLPRPLRHAARSARQLHGGHRLRRPEHRPAAAVGANRKLRPLGRRIVLRQVENRAARGGRLPGPQHHPAHCYRHLRPSQRNLHRAAFHRTPHRRHALGLRHRPTHPGARFPRSSRRKRSTSPSTSPCSRTCASGTGTPFTTPSPSSSPTAPMYIPTPMSIATPSRTSCARS